MLTVDFEHFSLPAGALVLDLGCGEGRHSLGAALAADVRVVGVDLSFDDIEAGRRKMAGMLAENRAVGGTVDFTVADALRLPFPDRCFDRIVCSEVLEHIPDYGGVLREIERVIKPGGLLCVSVPRYWPERICWFLSESYHTVPGGHVRIFRGRRLAEQVTSLGFSGYCRHGAHALHVPYWWLRCLLSDGEGGHAISRFYHRFLVWDLMRRPWLTRALEAVLNPLMGKSIVMYFRKAELG